MDEWKGRLVRLRKRMQTEGGVVLPEGDVMVVTGHHRGRLYLARLTEPKKDVIRHVNRDYDVELLPKDPKKVVAAILEAAETFATSLGGVLAYEVEVDGRKVMDRLRPEKVMLLQSVTRGSGIEYDEDGLPKALALG